MKRSEDPYSYTRIPSPTNEDRSGHPSLLRVDKSVVSSPPVDSRVVASIHYNEFSKFLVSYTERDRSTSTSRQKLKKLTRQQFQELRTDVYDELIRRKANSVTAQVPFLPAQEEFHPKRNQARLKLSTLPTYRFQDLCSDVYYELGRRYPEFAGEPSDTSKYENFPSPDTPNTPGGSAGGWTAPNRFDNISKNPLSGGEIAQKTTILL